MHVEKHSILTIYSGLSLSRYDVQHACTETLNTDTIFAPYSLSLSLVMTYNMHVQKHSILTIYSDISLSRYVVQHACTETLDTDNIFGTLSLSHYDVQHACTKTLNTDNISGPLSLSLWRTICMYRNTRYWQCIRDSFPLSCYDVKHACTETLNTGNIFGLLYLSFSLSLWRTKCMYRNTRYWQYIRASLSLSLVMTYNMHVQKQSILTI